MGLKPTTISYKNTEEDEKLRDWVHSHSNYSGFIKDVLRERMLRESNGEIINAMPTARPTHTFNKDIDKPKKPTRKPKNKGTDTENESILLGGVDLTDF